MLACSANGSMGLDQETWVAIIGASTALVTTVFTITISAFFKRQSERRKMYSHAIQAILSWSELLYRIRRSTSESDDQKEIRNLFHQKQEDINYYSSWISSESSVMSRSYRTLVVAVKQKISPLIEDAAQNHDTEKAPLASLTDEEHPDIQKETDKFMRDVRCHLSIWQFPKISVWKRNRDTESR